MTIGDSLINWCYVSQVALNRIVSSRLNSLRFREHKIIIITLLYKDKTIIYNIYNVGLVNCLGLVQNEGLEF